MLGLQVTARRRNCHSGGLALQERFRGLLTRYQAHLAACLEVMAGEGEITVGAAPQDAALILVSLVQGTAIRRSLGARR
jgi:hypothetical protein